MKLKSSHGVTLVELVVVIAVLGVLLGLLIPAVQQSRESARRCTCQNNLRQIGIAAHSFEAAHGYLPSNGWGYRWIADPTRGFGAKQPGGWVYHLSGFLEVTLPPGDVSDPFSQFWVSTRQWNRNGILRWVRSMDSLFRRCTSASFSGYSIYRSIWRTSKPRD